jgi:hypothetical protein
MDGQQTVNCPETTLLRQRCESGYDSIMLSTMLRIPLMIILMASLVLQMKKGGLSNRPPEAHTLGKTDLLGIPTEAFSVNARATLCDPLAVTA